MSSHGRLILYGGEMMIETTKIDHKNKKKGPTFVWHHQEMQTGPGL